MSALFATLWLASMPASTSTGTATLPLSELAPLFGASEALDARPQHAAVEKLTLKARPAESGLWLEGAVTVQATALREVLRLPILRVGPNAIFEELPSAEGAALVVEGPTLEVHCWSAGATTLKFKGLLRTTGAQGRHSALLSLGAQVAAAPLLIDADESLFELFGASFVREWGGLVVFPVDGRYEVTWRPRAGAQAAAKVVRPPVEPVIREVDGRWVSTLEGRATHELSATLTIDRPGALAVTLPKGQTLTRVRVNGAPRVVKAVDGVVTLEVAPASLGDTTATVELALAKDLGVFHLSGELSLEAPQLSWAVQRWSTSATLPAVFTWRREGGSMEMVADVDGGASTAAADQVPGHTLSFRQHLVSASAPDIALKYSVDISKSYFRGRAEEPR